MENSNEISRKDYANDLVEVWQKFTLIPKPDLHGKTLNCSYIQVWLSYSIMNIWTSAYSIIRKTRLGKLCFKVPLMLRYWFTTSLQSMTGLQWSLQMPLGSISTSGETQINEVSGYFQLPGKFKVWGPAGTNCDVVHHRRQGGSDICWPGGAENGELCGLSPWKSNYSVVLKENIINNN